MESEKLDGRQTDSSGGSENYSLGYGSASDAMTDRSATRQAAFFIPYLRSGIAVLDCGCGPGTITMGLAELDPTINATGVDLSEDQVNRAISIASERGIANLQFKSGSVYELPFPDESLDAVFSNALFEHLANPIGALREFRRVLKSGGVMGVRAAAHNPDLIYPPDLNLTKTFDLYTEVLRHNDGNPGVGARLGSMMREAGFSDVSMTASHDYYSAGSAARAFGEQVAEFPIIRQAVDLGIITVEEAKNI
jgi:ubiquinone/menaquinone biosynthesis C-methylase UbiE